MSNRKYKYRIEAFQKPLSAEAEYWAGLIATDGCVSTLQLQMNLSGEDSTHLYELRDFLGGACIAEVKANPKKIILGNMVNQQMALHLAACSRPIIHDLNQLGILPRKSLTLEVDPELATSPNFWRGAIDGDGSIRGDGSSRGICQLGLSSSSWLFIQQYRRFVDQILNWTPPASPCKIPNPNYKHWLVNLSGQKASRLALLLYGDESAPALPRKAVLAKKLISRLKNFEQIKEKANVVSV